MIHIDGSQGEGGGQILRTALSLSALLGLPVTIENIRANRPKAGLRPQHLTAVKALKEICGAEVEGMAVDSRRIAFRPGRVRPGNYFFDVGTAGSVTLILQALLLPLALAPGPSRIKLRGGTHVPWSPPYHYLAEVFLPTLALMGIQTAVRLGKWGWYPKGGGEAGNGYPSRRNAHTPGARSALGTRRSESPVRLLPPSRTHPGKGKEADRGPPAGTAV